MEELKNSFEVTGSVIEIDWNEAVYDSFVYNDDKIVVLKNEQFDEFIDAPTEDEIAHLQKHFMLGKIHSSEESDYIFALSGKEYDEALAYYLRLKKAFLEVSTDGK